MTKWYYRDFLNRKIGPLSADEFEACVIEGDIHPETRVWRSGLAAWTTYAALLEEDAVCASVTRGPAVRTAPRSSSHRTMIALGSSPVSRGPRSSPALSSSVAPHADQVVYEKSAANRRWAGRLAKRGGLERDRALDLAWLGHQFVWVALAATVILFIQVIFTEANRPQPQKAAKGVQSEQTEPLILASDIQTVSYAGLPTEFGPFVESQR